MGRFCDLGYCFPKFERLVFLFGDHVQRPIYLDHGMLVGIRHDKTDLVRYRKSEQPKLMGHCLASGGTVCYATPVREVPFLSCCGHGPTPSSGFNVLLGTFIICVHSRCKLLSCLVCFRGDAGHMLGCVRQPCSFFGALHGFGLSDFAILTCNCGGAFFLSAS